LIYRAKWVLPISGDIIENGEVWVENNKIHAVGRDLSLIHPDMAVRDLGISALLPGFVNAHVHLDPTMRRNSRDGLNLWDWLRNLGFRRGIVPDYDLLLASARLGAAECVRSGITCLGDSTISGAAAVAINESGLRGIVYKEVFGQSMGENWPERMALAVNDVMEIQKRLSARMKIGLSPHSVYTSNPEVLKYCADLDIPVSIHLAETEAEAVYLMNGAGPIADVRREVYGHEPMVSRTTPVRLLEDTGLLREGVVLAHCVHISDDEIEILAGSGAGLVTCPRSNAYLGTGVAPLVKLLKTGAKVGIGTDSAASCGTLDIFEEMRFTLGIHRAVEKDAGALSAKKVLELATLGGAKALGLDKCTGTLEPGKQADMIAVDLSEALPGEDIYLSILSRAPADVVLAMVDGQILQAAVDERRSELTERLGSG